MYAMQDAACARTLVGETLPLPCNKLYSYGSACAVSLFRSLVLLNAGFISRSSEDMNARVSALEVLLLISADDFAAQSISSCLDSAGVTHNEVDGPDLLRCQFRKLLDKLADHSSEAQNIAPNVPAPRSTVSWERADVSECTFHSKGSTDGTTCTPDDGNFPTSAALQSVKQSRVLQDAEPLHGRDGQQAKRVTPCLPALPPSMMFAAPPQVPLTFHVGRVLILVLS